MLTQKDINEALDVLVANSFSFKKINNINGDNISNKTIAKKIKLAEDNYHNCTDFKTKNIYFKMKTGFDLELDFDYIYTQVERILNRRFKRYRKEVLQDRIIDSIYKVFDNINMFDGKKSMFITWLFTVIKNDYLYHVLQKYNDIYELTNTFHEYEDILTYDVFETLDVELDFKNALKLHEAFVKDVYPNLKKVDKIVLQKREFEHKSYDDISKELKVNLNTVKSNIKAARKRAIDKLNPIKIKLKNNTDYYE